MNTHTSIKTDATVKIGHSACPHDCPSTCALDVEILAPNRIGRVHGAKDNSYTAGVICAKVARYAERVHHPDRLLQPMVRSGGKGEGAWKEASWEAALDLVADRLIRAEEKHGSETVWPNYYAGTMGLVQRDGINRLRHAKKYSDLFDSFCTNFAWTGFTMGTGRLLGPDPREMAKSDCVVIWGTNAVVTQVNVMTHAVRARKERGAKIVVVDVYDNATMKQADMGIVVKPGTDGALACAVMHVLFRDGLADRDYLAEIHRRSGRPGSASAVAHAGMGVGHIRRSGGRDRSLRAAGRHHQTHLLPAGLRLCAAAQRRRQHACGARASPPSPAPGSMRAAAPSTPTRTSSSSTRAGSKAAGLLDPRVRHLDQSKIGRVLTGDAEALYDGPPVTAMLIQNTNPANVAPEQRLVKRGMLREDLFTCVHEQFMTETAQLADVVLPATMFLEHDDIYRGGGNQHITLGPKLIDPPEGPRTNHFVIEELAKRLGVADMPGFGLTEQQHIDFMLGRRGLGDFASFKADKWADVQPDFETSHFLNGFAHKDGKFRFRPDWTGTIAPNKPPKSMGLQGRYRPASGIPRSCRPDRDRRRRASVPAGHLAGALIPQLDLHRDAELEGARGQARADDPPRRCRRARHRRRRPRRDRQQARRGRAARKTVRRPAPRRDHRGRHLAERRA